MDEDVLNLELRKFLKTVGVTSQREIEQAVRAAVDEGRVPGDAAIEARMTLELPAVGLHHVIEGTIALED